ncbi:hypothetical protein TVAG_207410 [Trichomonas vaginalis G3]|uniref:Uncharacterized protein n=1 Tax=Trichomonas vaginalis (strain ATCC PRA-98 / G3) TaxID=412133 RepID=A2F2K4_TRIV3|nr:armadillo (ARM) repeat-containing protein family [Trichomonas vaginalis G3]EAY00838.1 hypothetical protein TVAG_207410 [Trichomonas vaginalis G3]KAI5544593.1 armadillo (ARM) repeat-containing protein family [Trichomonas vaginalis G3]|eukprot:XP_001313767.1 hypothetical protein [Trichomonas vaginalis G3]
MADEDYKENSEEPLSKNRENLVDVDDSCESVYKFLEAFAANEEYFDKFQQIQFQMSQNELDLMLSFFSIAENYFDTLDETQNALIIYHISEFTLKLASIKEYATMILKIKFLRHFFTKIFDDEITINVLQIVDLLVQNAEKGDLKNIVEQSYHIQLMYVFERFQDFQVRKNIIIILLNLFTFLRSSGEKFIEFYEFTQLLHLSNIILESNDTEALALYVHLLSSVFSVLEDIQFVDTDIQQIFSLFGICKQQQLDVEIFECITYVITHLEPGSEIPVIKDFMNIQILQDYCNKPIEFQINALLIIFKYSTFVFKSKTEEKHVDYIFELLYVVSYTFDCLNIQSKLKLVPLVKELIETRNIDLIIELYNIQLIQQIFDLLETDLKALAKDICRMMLCIYQTCKEAGKIEFLKNLLEEMDCLNVIDEFISSSNDDETCNRFSQLLTLIEEIQPAE